MSRLIWPLRLVATLVAFAAAGCTSAEDLGTVGPTYAIEEPHLLNAIEQQLRAKEKSGELALQTVTSNVAASTSGPLCSSRPASAYSRPRPWFAAATPK